MPAWSLWIALFALAVPPDVDALLKEHYLSRTPTARAAAARKILETPGLTAKTLATAIGKVQLWEASPTGDQEMDLHLFPGDAGRRHVLVRVPEDYDPTKAWPLIITLHGSGANAPGQMAVTRQMLGRRAEQFILAAPQDLGPLNFTDEDAVVGQPRRLLVELRHRYHIDPDRVYFTGYSLGGHNTWMAGVMHADCFAGLMPLATPMQVIGQGMIDDDLLANLNNVPILFCWGARDNLGPDGKAHPQGGNAAMNKQIAGIMRRLKIKGFDGVERPETGHLGVAPPANKLSKWLDRKRPRWPKRVHQTFRLPEQSRAYWVEAEGLQGEPLSLTLKIPGAKPGEDPREAQRKFLLGRLGCIEASVEGQTITLQTRRSTYVALLLSDDLIDLDQPVTIVRNKKTVYTGPVPRDLSVMLRESAESWDFARLPSARVIVPVGGKVRFGYTTPKPKKPAAK